MTGGEGVCHWSRGRLALSSRAQEQMFCQAGVGLQCGLTAKAPEISVGTSSVTSTNRASVDSSAGAVGFNEGKRLVHDLRPTTTVVILLVKSHSRISLFLRRRP